MNRASGTRQGYLDFKGQGSTDKFAVSGDVMNADEFGNYIAGYGAGYALGPQGLPPLWLGGSAFGMGESVLSGEWELSQVLLLGDDFGSASRWFPGLVDGVRDGGWRQGLIMISPVVQIGAAALSPPH